MKDDYLWDKSGEPDPEIQQLEQVLGTLRYQPRELEIPAHIQPQLRRFVTRSLAIAAVVALIALGLGIFIRVQRQPAPQVVAESAPAKVESSPSPTANAVERIAPDNNSTAVNPRLAPNRTAAPRSTVTKRRRAPANNLRLSEAELAEARAAKDQLILALRVASSKLSQAQKRTQTNNEIHNQHKTG
ncbi:MAG TPA: hypothetical protein VJU86_21740 [Pyrinomonadaceae bacterium]|nr:hypothetical protein [Pyrinomonadaceae bacterium]